MMPTRKVTEGNLRRSVARAARKETRSIATNRGKQTAAGAAEQSAGTNSTGTVTELQELHRQQRDQCCPDLRLQRIGRGSHESLDAQILQTANAALSTTTHT